MAVPARRTSKTKKNKRRAHQKLSAPAIHWDPKQGEYILSHHVSPTGFYNGKQVLDR
ncbi:50S ribosomal protein L32 [Secundilactobacillus kimchicus]|uniref:50S ribosomal protein L32 n=1 Tax=Secundilactobacillus kimchicus TaxID=528209 RepID=UPI0024A80D1E|nr:50S ribosomal protein L32 [Secundilactobacillus kimchicus]